MLRLIFAFLLIGRSLFAAEYQWSVEVPGVISTETNASPRAYLWLPPKTERVKGLVYAPQNMLEQPILESGVPLLWVSGEYEWADERAGKLACRFASMKPAAPGAAALAASATRLPPRCGCWI